MITFSNNLNNEEEKFPYRNNYNFENYDEIHETKISDYDFPHPISLNNYQNYSTSVNHNLNEGEEKLESNLEPEEIIAKSVYPETHINNTKIEPTLYDNYNEPSNNNYSNNLFSVVHPTINDNHNIYDNSNNFPQFNNNIADFNNNNNNQPLNAELEGNINPISENNTNQAFTPIQSSLITTKNNYFNNEIFNIEKMLKK